MYQLIIFDWDGTLMDSAQKIANCIQIAARDMGYDVPSDDRTKSIIGLGLKQAIGVLFPDLNNQDLDVLVSRYKYHFMIDDTRQDMFLDVERGLQELNDAGALLAVATGKSRTAMTRVFNEIPFEKYFVTTRCGDESRSKPHPQMLHEILDYTAIDPKNTIMVGDTTYDMEMAHNANVHGLGASYGVHTEQQLRDAKAIDVLGSFTDILHWLQTDRIMKAYD